MTMIKRDPSFELKKHLSSNWANDDAFLTAVLNALSFCFPKGEKFFMNSVRAFKDDVRLMSLTSSLNARTLFIKNFSPFGKQKLKAFKTAVKNASSLAQFEDKCFFSSNEGSLLIIVIFCSS